MDFAFINDLMNKIDSNTLFGAGITGAKIVALFFLLLRLLDQYSKDNFDGQPKMGGSLNVLGFGFIIMSSDWVIKAIEKAFAGVDKTMASTQTDLYSKLSEQIWTKYTELIPTGQTGFLDSLAIIEAYISNGFAIAMLIVAAVLAGLCKIADLSITAGYLLQRVFILQLLKFLFPLAIAFSTSSQFGKFFYSWIMRYIGIFILGIAYIGIIKFTTMVGLSLANQFDTKSDIGFTAMSFYSFGLLVTIIVTFTIKVKLFSVVTSYVSNMFQ